MVNFSNFDKSKLKITVVSIGPIRSGLEVRYGKKRLRNKGNCRFVGKMNDVVIKIDYDFSRFSRERLYRQSLHECRTYQKLRKRDKPYFARTKSFRINGRHVEIQEFIKGKPMNSFTYPLYRTVEELFKRYKCSDLHDGNVILRDDNNKPVIVDFGL